MRYEKPSVVEVASAIKAVQSGTTARIHILVDVAGWVTIAAYQADES